MHPSFQGGNPRKRVYNLKEQPLKKGPALVCFLNQFPTILVFKTVRGGDTKALPKTAMKKNDDIDMPVKKIPERRAKNRRELAKRREKMRWELGNPIRRKNPGRRATDRLSVPDPKKRTELLSSLTGICVLTPSGRIGYFNEQRKFVVNTKLTESLLNYTIEFLNAYQADPNGGNHRLAIICQTEKAKPWGTETLIVEEFVVRRLYAVSGQTTAGLTAFQKRNREKSVYRGMELLLETHNETMPGIPIYCPVLYDRGTTLADYRSIAGSEKYYGGGKAPVIEVLNLIAPIPVNKRNASEILELIHNVHGRIIKKELRKTSGLKLVDDINARSGFPSSVLFSASEDVPEGSVQKVEPPAMKEADRPVAPQALNKMPAQVKPTKRFETWLEIPNRPIDIAKLKKFQPFRELKNQHLSILAAKSLVFKAPPGALLLDRGTNDRWNMYLLGGKVALEAADGTVEVIDADSDQASIPIACLKPRQYVVRAVTSVTFLWINDDVIPNNT